MNTSTVIGPLLRSKIVWFCFLMLSLPFFSVQAQRVEQKRPPLARFKTGSHLLRDGITSPDHRALMRQYDIHFYKLDLQVERTSIDLKGSVTIGATALTNHLQQFAFELHPSLHIDSVWVNKQKASVQRNAGEAIVALPQTINQNQDFSVQIFYGGTAPSGTNAAIGNGFNNRVAQPWGNQITWSLSEPFAAYEWFPCKQLLEDKADSVEVFVTTDVSNKVGSNGLLQQVVDLPNNKHRYEWKSRYPIAYYLISVAIGQYQEYSFSVTLPGLAQPMLVQNYLYEAPNVLEKYKAEVEQTGPLLQTFSKLIGLYPFYQEKYGHSMAPLGGGMEHQTMTTQSTFEFTLTAHELAHQWWGDEVTCADWSHIWLNEGFASYAEYLALEQLKSPSEARDWLDRADLSARAPSSGSVFVRDSLNVPRIFSSNLSYDKGAFVLHMLRDALQDDSLFFQTLRSYREQYRYKVATTRNFQQAVEQKSGRSFQQFFDQWVYGEGFPLSEVRWAQEGRLLYLKSIQTPSSSATPLFVTEVEYLIKTSRGDTLVRLLQDNNDELYTLALAGTVLDVEVDPRQRILNFVRGVYHDESLLPPANSISELKLYPNPTNQDLFLEGGPGVPDEVEVLDLLGRHLFMLPPLSRTLSLNGLKSGAYLLRLRYGEEITVQRFIRF